jgi:hypothetical protein
MELLPLLIVAGFAFGAGYGLRAYRSYQRRIKLRGLL